MRDRIHLRHLCACALMLFGSGDRPAVLAHPVDPEKPPAAFTAVNKSLRDTRCIRADFDEEKTIQVLKRPLLSSGSLIFNGNLGLYRALRSPFVQELLVTKTGIEGSLVYAFSAGLRDAIAADGHAMLRLDLLPQHSRDQVLAETRRPRGTRSLSTHLKSRLGLHGVKMALLHELVAPDELHDSQALARAIKALPLTLLRPRPLDEAISTAGGVRFEALDAALMATAAPGLFCAGEMLDWEAPTGGYLLTACLASGRAAGLGAAGWLAKRRSG